MMLIINYDIYLNILSLFCELVIIWCFFIYTLYICFFYFFKQNLNCESLLFIYLFSLLLIFFCSSNTMFSVVGEVFGGVFFVDVFDLYMRNFLLFFIFLIFFAISPSLVVNLGFVNSIEFILLSYVLILCVCCILYCSDYFSFFLFLELQSMIVYILVCMSGLFSSMNIGIRYFLLGTIVSLIFLGNFTYLYYYTGLSGFFDYIYLNHFHDGFLSAILYNSMYLLFFFKLYLVPFHFFGGDLYRNSSIYVLFFISVVFYYMYLYLYLKLMLYWLNQSLVVYLFIMLTLILGALNLVNQRDLRSFLGFSTSVHSAILLYIVYIGGIVNMFVCLFYGFIYIVCLFGILLIILKTRCVSLNAVSSGINNFSIGLSSNSVFLRNSILYKNKIEFISGWSGISMNYRYIAIYFSIFLWSIAGLPPFSGFFAKLSMLILCYVYDYWMVFLFILVISLLSSLYYLKVIKEFFYVRSSYNYISYMSDLDIFMLIVFCYLCIFSVCMPEFFIFLFY